MHLGQHVDEMAAALDTGRRRLTSVDLGNVVDSARAGARAAASERWPRPKRRSRWPIVAGVLVVGAVVATILFLLPTLRRAIDEDSVGGDPDTRPDTIADFPPKAAPYPTNPWGRTSEETIDGEEAES